MENIADFATYMNGFALRKWKEYTGLDNLSLTLCVKGKFRVNLTGYKLEPVAAVRCEFASRDYHFTEKTEITLQYPENDSELVAFEIEADEATWVYGGYYASAFPEEQIRDVNLSLATTTFRKEDYITRNVRIIREELLEGNDEIKEHLFVNVIDNGRTLTKEMIESEHVRLFFNDNVGGSGGFSRGMLESIHMKPEITHVLLMDDDVLILPESIRRTYTLLKLVRDEYREAFVSGAMLEMDSMTEMWEDTGVIMGDKSFRHAKPKYNVSKLKNVLEANRPIPKHTHMYAGWWYCCIPAAVIRRQGFALPLFVRGDDVDYGLRCQPKFITMSGICIWHMGFVGKYNAAQNLYQEFRNVFIVKAAGGKIPDVDVLGRWKQECLRARLTFDYGGWELLLMAMEDYLKGPSFIAVDRGTEILQRNKAFVEKLVPVAEADNPNFVMEEIEDEDRPMSFLERVVYYLSDNGQRFVPDRRITDSSAVMRYDWDHKPGRCAFHRRIYVYNDSDRMGICREMNKEKYRELQARENKLMRRYDKIHEKVEEAYRKAYPYLTSEKFWRKYLKLEEEN